jgi:hypothetical protein
MATGFAKLGIPLSHQELERVWNAIIECGEGKQNKINFGLFKIFYERHNKPRNNETATNQQGGNTMMSGPNNFYQTGANTKLTSSGFDNSQTMQFK